MRYSCSGMKDSTLGRGESRPRYEKPGPGVISTGGTEKNKCDAELFVACFVKNLNFFASRMKEEEERTCPILGGSPDFGFI